MEQDLLETILGQLGLAEAKVSSISGGDISEAYLIEGMGEKYFCKYNKKSIAHEMFLKEEAALAMIGETGVIKTPKTITRGNYRSGGFLVVGYIGDGPKTAESMQEFGRSLARMHLLECGDLFGYEEDNFIGSLRQVNQKTDSWAEFFGVRRLGAQIDLAAQLNLLTSLEIRDKERLVTVCKNLIPEPRPSLIHGDLWGGNYLISDKGEAYLIDPACYFGHGEVDLAMSELFGGFSSAFYDGYYEVNPQLAGYAERRDIYQLYYLLVHLNLFGSSYYSAVKRILDKYF